MRHASGHATFGAPGRRALGLGLELFQPPLSALTPAAELAGLLPGRQTPRAGRLRAAQAQLNARKAAALARWARDARAEPTAGPALAPPEGSTTWNLPAGPQVPHSDTPTAPRSTKTTHAAAQTEEHLLRARRVRPPCGACNKNQRAVGHLTLGRSWWQVRWRSWRASFRPSSRITFDSTCNMYHICMSTTLTCLMQ